MDAMLVVPDPAVWKETAKNLKSHKRDLEEPGL